MLGQTPSLYWRICWKFISPVFLFVIMVLQIFDESPFSMKMYNSEEYVYPLGARLIGYGVALSSVLMIPALALRSLYRKKGNFGQKLLLSISPEKEEKDILEGKFATRKGIWHWISI